MDALLADAAPVAARTASLAATLGAVRARRHQRRRRQQLLAIGALALLLVTASWWWKPRPDAAAAASAQPSLPALVRVTTQPLPAEATLVTRPDSVRIIDTGAPSLILVHSAPGDPAARRLTDDELLGLVSGRAIALVGMPGHAELVVGVRPTTARLQ